MCGRNGILVAFIFSSLAAVPAHAARPTATNQWELGAWQLALILAQEGNNSLEASIPSVQKVAASRGPRKLPWVEKDELTIPLHPSWDEDPEHPWLSGQFISFDRIAGRSMDLRDRVRWIAAAWARQSGSPEHLALGEGNRFATYLHLNVQSAAVYGSASRDIPLRWVHILENRGIGWLMPNGEAHWAHFPSLGTDALEIIQVTEHEVILLGRNGGDHFVPFSTHQATPAFKARTWRFRFQDQSFQEIPAPLEQLPGMTSFRVAQNLLRILVRSCVMDTHTFAPVRDRCRVADLPANFLPDLSRLLERGGVALPSVFLLPERGKRAAYRLDGEERIARTGLSAGSPIFINADLLATEGTRLDPIEALAILIHEYGHQTGETDHARLDTIAGALARVVRTFSETIDIPVGDQPEGWPRVELTSAAGPLRPIAAPWPDHAWFYTDSWFATVVTVVAGAQRYIIPSSAWGNACRQSGMPPIGVRVFGATLDRDQEIDLNLEAICPSATAENTYRDGTTWAHLQLRFKIQADGRPDLATYHVN